MSECYRRFNNGTYLLTCGLDKGHQTKHREMDGDEEWPLEAGFDDEYTGAPVKYDPDRVRPEPVYVPAEEPEVETLAESVARAPQFYKRVVRVEADENGFIKLPKQTIAQRLAQRKLINAALKEE